MSNTERAWAAGFFDGEGCSSISTRRPTTERPLGRYQQLFLVVSQSGSEAPILLNRFRDAVGIGRVRLERLPSPGKLIQYRWQVGSPKDAYIAMRALWEYLGPVKRTQFLTNYKKIRRHRMKIWREGWIKR